MAKAKTGWFGERTRHSNARRYGRAGGKYSGIATRPINKNADKIFYYESPDAHFDPTQLQIGTAVEMEHTKDPKIAKAIAKAHLKEDKDYYQKLIVMENKPNPPLEMKDVTELPLQFRITIPSTKDVDKKLSTPEFKARIAEVDKDLTLMFGGQTTLKGTGGYVAKNGKFIPEGVAIVETSMTPAQYEENKAKINEYLRRKREEWGQESILFGFEDENYIYPKFD